MDTITHDIVLKGKLANVEIGFKEDEYVYLVCEYPAQAQMIERKINVVQEALEKATGKAFEVRTTTEKDFEEWYMDTYGGQGETVEDDAEFASLMGMYFPEADMEG